MRYSTFLLIAIYGAAIAVVATFATVGPTILFDGGTLLRFLLLLCTLGSIVIIARRRRAPLELLLVTTTLLYFAPPMIGYMWYPDLLPFGGRTGMPPIYASHVNRGLLYVTLGCMVMTLGLSAGRALMASRQPRRQPLPMEFSPKSLIVLWVTIAAFEFFITLRFGSFSTVLNADRGGRLMFLMRFINSDTVIYAGLVAMPPFWRRFTRAQRFTLVIAALVAIGYRTVTGTRQIILSMVIITIMAMLSSAGDFRIPTRFIGVAMLLMPLSLVGFGVATTIRDYWDFSQKAGRYLKPSEFVEAAAATAVDTPQTFQRRIFPLFWRLNGMDPLATVVSDTGVDLPAFVNPKNDVKSFINIITPGTPFPGVYEPAKTFLVIYRNYPIIFLSLFYVSTMWTLWGYVYAELGWWLGLAAVFFIGVMLAGGYELLSRWRSRVAPYAQVWWLLSAYSLYNSYGFDTDAATSIYVLLPFVVTLVVLTVFKRWGAIRERRRNRPKPRRRAALPLRPRVKAQQA